MAFSYISIKYNHKEFYMKKKNVLVCGIFAAAMLTALALTACDQPNDTGNAPGNPGSNPGGNPSGSVAVTTVTLNQSSLSLTVGNTAALTATVQPSDASNKSVNWSSSNTGVATVNNGTVTAVAAGSATITVTTADGGKTAVCAVTVSASQGVTGSTNITINFDGPAEDIVLQSGSSDSTSVTFTVANSAQYGNYRWILDGTEQSGTLGSITFNKIDLAVGLHRLTVIASKNGTVYSREQKFTVSE